ncbi:MAG: class I SAM-dependent methyltransferase [Clostridiaceae bacterium]|nr:class I SAM-dependent methyltransferase [Clostridiaceae bacterium]
MKMDAKELFLNTEGDAWYRRNRHKIETEKNLLSAELMIDFLNRQKHNGGMESFSWNQFKVLEVGCSYGYNLERLWQEFACKCYGIEPSKEAIMDGNKKYEGLPITLIQGTGDALPFESETMDIVIMGFCMFWMDRKYILQAYAEADRVLKTKGLLMIYDFDTKLPYIRDNVHHRDAFTYKMDYAQTLLASPQYYLLDKTVYCHAGNYFDERVQERVSLQILYKEEFADVYIKG